MAWTVNEKSHGFYNRDEVIPDLEMSLQTTTIKRYGKEPVIEK